MLADNRVYDPFLANISGFDAMALEYGYYYTFNDTPRSSFCLLFVLLTSIVCSFRAQLFRRDVGNVTEFVSSDAEPLVFNLFQPVFDASHHAVQ